METYAKSIPVGKKKIPSLPLINSNYDLQSECEYLFQQSFLRVKRSRTVYGPFKFFPSRFFYCHEKMEKYNNKKRYIG